MGSISFSHHRELKLRFVRLPAASNQIGNQTYLWQLRNLIFGFKVAAGLGGENSLGSLYQNSVLRRRICGAGYECLKATERGLAMKIDNFVMALGCVVAQRKD
jgi:hypothetical protein